MTNSYDDQNPIRPRSIREIFGPASGSVAPINTHFETRPTSPSEPEPEVERETSNLDLMLMGHREVEYATHVDERPEIDPDDERWYGTLANLDAVHQFRRVYGQDETWKRESQPAKWTKARANLRKRITSIPSRAEAYRLNAMCNKWPSPGIRVKSAAAEQIVIDFFKAEAGIEAINVALEILRTDRWVFFHPTVRMYLDFIKCETEPGDGWGNGNLVRLINDANETRKLSRQYGAVARRKDERDRDGFCRY